jgi:hypothetical protein
LTNYLKEETNKLQPGEHSNNSLQPSMSEFGSIPLPEEKFSNNFDVDGLFAEDKEEREEKKERGRSISRTRDRGDYEREKEREQEREQRRMDDENIKTVYLGKSLSNDRKYRNTDMESENSDDDGFRAQKNIGGENYVERQNEDVPIVSHPVPRVKLDLDVFSTNDELPITSNQNMFLIDKNSIDINQNKPLPSLNNMEDDKFFSDAE